MRSVKVGLAMFVMVMLAGCNLFGNGGNGGSGEIQIPAALIDLIVAQGVTGDFETGSWHSPTAEPGMESVHATAISVSKFVIALNPELKAFCETGVGASLLLRIVNSAACPVCKGALQAGGWTLVDYYKPVPPNGMIGILYYAEGHGTVIGKPDFNAE